MATNLNAYEYGTRPGVNALNTTVNYDGANLKPDQYFDKMLLKMLRQLDFHFMKYATEKTLPRNFADTINWRRFIKLSPNTDVLQEARTPEGRLIRGTALTATIAQYGDVMYFSDLVDVMQLDDVKREYTVELGYLAKETLDIIVRNTLVAEGSAFFANGATDLSTYTTAATNGIPNFGVRVDDIRKITIGMKRAHLSGSRKAGGKYLALVSPEIMYDLFDDNRMQTYMNFGQTNAPFRDGLAIEMFGIRFEEVLNAPIIAAQFNSGTEQAPVLVDFEVHDIIILGEEGYAVTKLEGAGIRIITKGLGSAGVEDPLDQRQSIGWKITGFGAKVLNQESVVNYWVVPSIYAGGEWVAGTATAGAPVMNDAGSVTSEFSTATSNFWLKNKKFVYYLEANDITEIDVTVIKEADLPAVTTANNDEIAIVLESAKLFKVVAGAWVDQTSAVDAAWSKYEA
jgi:N4-gp56 family major capsid protein